MKKSPGMAGFVGKEPYIMKKEIVAAGIHNYTPPEEYVPPKSPQVQQHL